MKKSIPIYRVLGTYKGKGYDCFEFLPRHSRYNRIKKEYIWGVFETEYEHAFIPAGVQFTDEDGSLHICHIFDLMQETSVARKFGKYSLVAEG
jgi:hypothetical protein